MQLSASAPLAQRSPFRTMTAGIVAMGCVLVGTIPGAQAAMVVPAGTASVGGTVMTGQWILDDTQGLHLCYAISYGIPPIWEIKPDCVDSVRPVRDDVSVSTVLPGAITHRPTDGRSIVFVAHVWVVDTKNRYDICHFLVDWKGSGKEEKIKCTPGWHP